MRSFLKKTLFLILPAVLLAAVRLGAEPGGSGFSFSNAQVAQSDDRLWALVLIPNGDDAEIRWMGALEHFPFLRLHVALSSRDLARLGPERNILQQYRALGRLEPVLRLYGDPPIPLVYDLDSVKPFLPPDLPLPAGRIGWIDDVTGPIARGRARFKMFFGEYPHGFVPGGGALSLPTAEALRAQKFQWTVIGSTEPEWPAGETLDFRGSGSGQDDLWIFSAHPASLPLYFEPAPSGLVSVVPSKQEPPLERAVREMLRRIDEAHFQQQLPVVVFDERRARFPLHEFLDECARQLASRRDFRMVLLSETYQRNLFRLSDSLQIWPYSWNWMKGDGTPSGPGLTAWIGDREKNAAWELLSRTREDVERYKNSGRAELKELDEAMEPIYLAESGDFFESFGTGAPAAEREKRFKALLGGVYRHIEMSVPEALRVPLSELPPAVQAGTSSAAGAQASPDNGPVDLRIEQRKQSVAWISDEPDRPGPSIRRFSVQVSSAAQAESVLFSFGTRNAAPGAVSDLYIDINHRDGAGSMTLLPGRRAMVESTDGWEYVLVSRLQSGKWDCRLYRENFQAPVYHASAPDRGGSFSVKIPRNLLGLHPLHWGYLVCIMENNGGPIVDFMSPVADKPKTLADLQESSGPATAPSGETDDLGIKAILPMMRARPSFK